MRLNTVWPYVLPDSFRSTQNVKCFALQCITLRLALKTTANTLRRSASSANWFLYSGLPHTKCNKLGRAMSYQLTPEQQALSIARKKKKEEAAATAASSKKDGPTYVKLLSKPAAKVLAREWLYGGGSRRDGSTLVATWNVSEGFLSLAPSYLVLFIGIDSRTDSRQCVPLSHRFTEMLLPCDLGRDLFLGSDCLRTAQRHPMILAEIVSQKADIFCLQVSTVYLVSIWAFIYCG
jgi:hypothetical protein